MEQLYSARYLLPVHGAPIEGGAILVRGGRIVAVGERDAVRRGAPTAPCTDFGDAVLLPPFANAHTHLELTHYPRWAADLGEAAPPASFVDWILQVIRVKRGGRPERYLPSLLDGIRLCLRSGTAAVGDILSCFPARAGYAGTPLMGRAYLETLGRDPALWRRLLGDLGTLLDGESPGALEYGVSPHSPYTLSAEHLEAVYALAERRRLPSCTHFAESPEEVAFLDESCGALAEVLYPHVGWRYDVPPPARRSPARYLDERGGLHPSSLLVHGVQVSDADAGLLARRGATVVLCPRSNARLGVGTAPAARLRDAGVALALGTDSLASCDSLSLWDELAFASELFTGSLSPRELLAMATVGGSRALGLETEMGTLQAGRGAHFQILSAAPQRLGELEEFLCAPGRTADVAALYIDGRDVLQIS